MTNKPKAKGTRFETQLVNYLRTAFNDDRIERRALHGSRDLGDIYGLKAHGMDGIVEAKAHKTVTRALVLQWREQTLDERDNADADWALLVVKVPQKPVGQSVVHVTMRDLAAISLYSFVLPESAWEWADGRWMQMTLDECLVLMGADDDRAG